MLPSAAPGQVLAFAAVGAPHDVAAALRGALGLPTLASPAAPAPSPAAGAQPKQAVPGVAPSGPAMSAAGHEVTMKVDEGQTTKVDESGKAEGVQHFFMGDRDDLSDEGDLTENVDSEASTATSWVQHRVPPSVRQADLQNAAGGIFVPVTAANLPNERPIKGKEWEGRDVPDLPPGPGPGGQPLQPSGKGRGPGHLHAEGGARRGPGHLRAEGGVQRGPGHLRAVGGAQQRGPGHPRAGGTQQSSEEAEAQKGTESAEQRQNAGAGGGGDLSLEGTPSDQQRLTFEGKQLAAQPPSESAGPCREPSREWVGSVASSSKSGENQRGPPADGATSKWKTIFLMYDRDGDGQLTRSEFLDLVLSLGWSTEVAESMVPLMSGGEAGHIQLDKYLDYFEFGG